MLEPSLSPNEQAGRALPRPATRPRLMASRLAHMRGQNPTHRGHPRGAVPFGKILAEGRPRCHPDPQAAGPGPARAGHRLGERGSGRQGAGAHLRLRVAARAALGVGGPHFEPDAEWLREILNREGRRLGAGAQLSPRLVPQRDRGQGKGSTFSVELKLSENLLTNESPLAIKKRYLLEHPRSRMAMTITSPFFSQRIG
jgi:hypothetical protein